MENKDSVVSKEGNVVKVNFDNMKDKAKGLIGSVKEQFPIFMTKLGEPSTFKKVIVASGVVIVAAVSANTVHSQMTDIIRRTRSR